MTNKLFFILFLIGLTHSAFAAALNEVSKSTITTDLKATQGADMLLGEPLISDYQGASVDSAVVPNHRESSEAIAPGSVPSKAAFELTEECKAYSLKYANQTLGKIEIVRNSIAQELGGGSYANSPQGYLILAYVIGKNPYQGLKNLESGTKNHKNGARLSRRQKIIMQKYCDNNGHIDMELITQ